MTTDGLLLAATHIYLSLVKPQDGAARRAELRWRAADEAVALHDHLLMMERDDSIPKPVSENARTVFLRDCLKAAGGNASEAARIAGISHNTFWYAAKRAGIITPKRLRSRKEEEK